MVFEIRSICEQIYIISSLQGVGAVGVATIFEKMSCFLGFLQEPGGIFRAGVAMFDGMDMPVEVHGGQLLSELEENCRIGKSCRSDSRLA